MIGKQNLHTHTTYVDGNKSAEDMIKAALKIGMTSIGFSEHSYLPFDKVYSMTEEQTRQYAKEITHLKEKYRGEIEVFLGLERDSFSKIEPDIEFDYIIGTAHWFSKDGEYICVDNGSKPQNAAVKRCCGGDFYTFVEEYFAVMANIVKETKADIVGHFDLVTKYNENNCAFDENHPRYIYAAISAMDQILKSCKIFEINTGAVYRYGKKEQYPSTYLLKELKARGGEVILSSDSHCAESLCFYFDEMAELVKSCGFTHIKQLTADGFIDVKI